jgi:FtsH-binding integral membrane protein
MLLRWSIFLAYAIFVAHNTPYASPHVWVNIWILFLTLIHLTFGIATLHIRSLTGISKQCALLLLFVTAISAALLLFSNHRTLFHQYIFQHYPLIGQYALILGAVFMAMGIHRVCRALLKTYARPD